jgi:hypothetical protein
MKRWQQMVLPGVDVVVRVPTAMSRASKAGRRELPAPKPWLCVVLAVDTATNSGWSIYDCGKYVDSGELNTTTYDAAERMDAYVRLALDLAEHTEAPCVMVLETPYGGSVDVIAALGAARERWLRAWRDARQPKAKVILVAPSTWRGALGISQRGGREAIRETERMIARAKVKRDVGSDEAPAILIGLWASSAGSVGRAIGKRARNRSLDSWTKGAVMS